MGVSALAKSVFTVKCVPAGVVMPLAAALLASCAPMVPIGTQPGLTLTGAAALPEPVAADFAVDTRPYHVGPLDKLKIDVFGVADLMREIQIDAGGKFTFPLIGSVDANGKTLQQLSEEIAGRLRGKFVRNPSVTINLVDGVSQTVTVDGQVGKPGQYPVTGKMTLIQAIAAAQGTSEFAQTREVIVFRTVAGNKYAGVYNLDAIRRGNYGDPQIFPNDIVVVGDSPAKRAFRTIIQAAPLITTPLIIALQRI